MAPAMVSISTKMIEAAALYAEPRSARIVEAYGVEPKKSLMLAVFAFPVLASACRSDGFR